ncbi:thioredoxin domain-containing protein [Pisciglobus halotolerans]|uniref:Protein-disulfide isomerase n=1 Tax=Pisciglobus halotolerans TaxID=745365 RepID=A0A1I3C1K6_9LACT|nr:thioredoxin domain-containing protein [Pisciglobus halotolerans]SFH68437.1 Protein-disulfide isomerase [Pisciglobus halotolerans]
MDISNIKANEVDATRGIRYGEESAPVKVLEFINLNCPYCKQWYEESREVLNRYVNEGKVQRIIKLFDKEKPSLRKGNVVHHYMDYNNPGRAIEEMDYFFAHQDEWGALDEAKIGEYVEEKRGLLYHPIEDEIQGIIQEAERANVVFVPTIFIGDHIFDEHMTPQELEEIIEKELLK